MSRQLIFWSVSRFIGLFVAGLLGGTLGPLLIGTTVAIVIRNLLQRLFPGAPPAPDDNDG